MIDSHNHVVQKNYFSSKKLAIEIAKAPDKKPITIYQGILKQIREVEEKKKVEDENEENEEEKRNEDQSNESGEIIEEDQPQEGRSKAQILGSIRAAKSLINSQGELLCLDDIKAFIEENLYNGTSN